MARRSRSGTNVGAALLARNPSATTNRPPGAAAELERLGFREIEVEGLQMRVAPSVLHIPWVTLRFLVTDVLLGKREVTAARWNDVLAPILLPLVSPPLGSMTYCEVTATKG
jgi:hypothetical protein